MYKLLRNLNDKDRLKQLMLAIEAWKKGNLLLEWKVADVLFIPKSGKPPQVNKFRPISIRSCVGKVVERMI